jgi:hypothetical protein
MRKRYNSRMDPFTAKLMLAFVIGGLWVTMATVAAEKYGTKVGGLLAGLPSTVVMVLFFVGWTQSIPAAVSATSSTALGAVAITLYLLVYIWLAKKNFWVALISALGVWFLVATLILLTKQINYARSLIIFGMILASSFYLVERVLRIKSVNSKPMKYSLWMIGFRAILSGLIVGLAVYLAKVGGPIFGGLFAMFPAVFTGTLLVTYLSQGSAFSSATMKMGMLSVINLVFYSLLIRYSYPYFGLIWGTVLALAVSYAVGGLIYLFARNRIA